MIKGIRYLKNNQIDKKKWDACIAASERSYIYAYSWYLDACADNWDALVWEDYKVIMPITWRKKMGVRYIYQPVYIQTLAIIGNNLNNSAIYDSFLKILSTKFRWIHIQTNYAPALSFKAIVKERINFYLPLEHIHQKSEYRLTKDFRKNLNKSIGLTLRKVNSVINVMHYYQAAYGKYLPKQNKDLAQLHEALIAAHNKQAADFYEINDESGELIFSAAILKEKNRLIYIAGAPNAKGREKSVTHFFIDSILQEYAGSDYSFDFSGSDIPNVANFYQKFNPEKEVIYEIIINRLPFLLKKVKMLREAIRSK